MKHEVPLPSVPFWRILAILVGLAVGWQVFTLQQSTASPLDEDTFPAAANRATFDETRSLETEWLDSAFDVDTVFPTDVMLAPLPAAPCSGGCEVERVPSAIEEVTIGALSRGTERALSAAVKETGRHWLPTLAYVWFLLEENRNSDAIRELTELVGSGTYRRDMNARFRSADEILGEIYVLHSLAYARIADRAFEADELVEEIRDAINNVDVLSAQGKTDRALELPSWQEHRLRRPGSNDFSRSLTSHDLYNNLIQLYLRGTYEESDGERRDREMRRSYNDPPTRNPLQQALVRAQVTALQTNEAMVWALSNVERLARDRREVKLGPPKNDRLALTMAHVMAQADRFLETPSDLPEAREALWREVAVFVGTLESKNGADDYAPALVRLELLSHVAGFPFESRATLDSKEAKEVREAVRTASRLRLDDSSRRALLTGESVDLDPIRSAGFDAGEWQRVLRRDSAVAVARAALDPNTGSDPVKQVLVARELAQGEIPAEVSELEASLGWWEKTRLLLAGQVARVVIALVAGIVVFAILWWWALQMRMHKMLFTSFYRLEAQARLKGPR